MPAFLPSSASGRRRLPRALRRSARPASLLATVLATVLAVGLAGCAASAPRASQAPTIERVTATAPTSTPSADHAAVVQAVQRLFDGMAAADTVALRALLHPQAQLIVVGAGGRIDTIPAAGWIGSFATTRERIVERMWDPKVEVRGNVATLWAPYDLTVDGAFSHCGIDAVQLVRDGGAWRPFVVSFTMERTGCPPAPPRG